MAINTVRVNVNGSWVTLTLNGTTGKYEGTIAAPNITSYNVNAGHYYPVTVEASDLAGNITTVNDTHASLGSSLKLTVKEVTIPTSSFTAPSAGGFVITNTPVISFQLRDEVNGSGIKITSLAMKIDGGATLTNTSPGMSVNAVSNGYDVTYTPQVALADGSHTITIDIQDNDGNAAVQTSRTFKVDTVPPTLNITVPAEATSYRNSAAITITGTTNDAVSSPVTVTVKLNAGTATAVTVDGSGNFSKALTLVEGTNTVTVVATDSAGKSSTVVRTIILDTVAPVVSAITIAPNPVNVGQSYLITVTVTD
jgi:hypothetical protein